MKDVKIGKVIYQKIETLFDINDERFNVFKQYLLQTFERMDKPIFMEAYSRIISYFDKGQHADAIIELHNFKKAVELDEFNYDAYGYCFALLHLEKDEEQHETGTDKQIKKLHNMRRAGLTRGQVEADVINFIKQHPEPFAVYIQMLEMMKPELKAEYLKE